MSAERLTGILEALQSAIEQARNVPLSSSVMVNRAELLDLVAQAHQVLPDQLTRADEVLAQAETVLAGARADSEEIAGQAREQAEQIVAQAREEAARLTSAEQVVAEANAEAERIIAAATTEAGRLRHDAEGYADKHLGEFQEELNRIAAQVAAGRERLAQRLQE